MKNFTFTIAFFAVIGPIAGSVSGDVLCDIMPLGDSITAGYFVDGGYRAPLFERLNVDGYSFRFVGTQSNWPTAALTAAGQQFHEGHSGYIIDGRAGDAPRAGLYENMANWIGPGGANRPDVILLMIGTNDMDFGDGYRVGEAPARLDSLITLISDTTTGLEPDAKLLVASLTPSTDSTSEANIQAFNAQVPGIVDQHRAAGENVYFVDMYEALDPAADLGDWLHPNPSGYTKMGDIWNSAVEQIVVPEPSTSLLAAMGLLCLALVPLRKYRAGQGKNF
ncbi:MAG: SGNH/GDSL hydrolase family protein [Planctomycetota bacterium]|nr:SGNH/GDSL hydrolase family protein [Planctomycetota bacterium]